MEAYRKMDVVTTERRGKETATAATEATTETVGIQAMQTATPAEDNNSDHGGSISPLDNSSTPKTFKLSTIIITVEHTESTLPMITQFRHATNRTHQACTTPTQQDRT